MVSQFFISYTYIIVFHILFIFTLFGKYDCAYSVGVAILVIINPDKKQICFTQQCCASEKMSKWILLDDYSYLVNGNVSRYIYLFKMF